MVLIGSLQRNKKTKQKDIKVEQNFNNRMRYSWREYPTIMLNKFKAIFTFLLCFGAFLAFSPSANAAVSIPVIDSVSSGRTGDYTYPVITGKTATNTELLIYIDGSFNGMADVYGSVYAPSFRYEQIRALPEGEHRIMAVSRDLTSMVLSAPTKEITLSVSPYIEPGTVAEQPFVPAPRLIAPNEKTVTAKVKPLITGLSANGSFVRIFIDGAYNGKTNFVYDNSGTADFVYRPFLNLARGWHKVKAYSEDSRGRRSEWSRELSFRIEEEYPAPVVKTPKNGGKTANKSPLVSGLAKNGSEIQVFIDKKLDGKLRVEDDESGTANFSYLPFLPLRTGNHLVYAVAVDERGKESKWSEIKRFSIGNAIISQTSSITSKEEGVEDEYKTSEPKVETPAKSETSNNAVKPEINEDPKSTPASEEKKSDVDDILEKLGIGEKDETASSANASSTSEDQSVQNKNRLNLVIFLIFLLGVVAWIFWVNRELAKEKKPLEDENGNKDEKNQNL
jgi:hypothetical protein